MRIIRSKNFPPRNFDAISLFGIIFYRTDKPLLRHVITHEEIHFRQQLELLFVGFFVWYALEFLVRFFCTFNFWKAYLGISFEREAEKNEDNKDYLNHRKFFNFLRYIRK